VTPAARRFGTRLEVDVGGAVLGRLEDHRVDEADERGIRDPVVGFEVVLTVQVVVAADDDRVEERRVHRLGCATEAAQLSEHVTASGDVEHHVEARCELQLVEPAHVLWVRDRDLDRLSVAGKRDRADALEDGQRDQLRRAGIDAGDRQVDQWQVVLLGQGARDAERTREAFFDERVGERAAGRRTETGQFDLVRWKKT
jgi:hypothetical protein